MDLNVVLGFILPENVLEYFDVIDMDTDLETIFITLEEKPLTKEEIGHRKIESKGFYPPSKLKDFPLRDKAGVLIIKRRRWTDHDNKTIFRREFDIKHMGTRMTSEFARFLNKTRRSQSNLV